MMFKTILVPVDVNDPSSWRKALPVAGSLARTHGAQLVVMGVMPEFGLPMVSQYFPPDYEEKMREALDARLHELIRTELAEGPSAVVRVTEGSVYREILAVAKDVAADLIVMGSHRPGLQDYLLGPNAARVVRHATCSVMVLRE